MAEIEPCPLCQSPMEAVFSHDGDELFVTGYQHVYHGDCALRYYRLPVKEVPAWNRRSHPPRRCQWGFAP